MKRRTSLAVAAATTVAAIASAGALAAGGGSPVTIRLEGAKKTLLLPTAVHTHGGWITKYGAPKGQCSAQSAQGALDVATHGDWTGKWYPTYHEYLITSILGEAPQGSDYWTIFVNNKTATQGACDIKASAGQQLLFAVTNGHVYPSWLQAPASAVAGHPFKVKLMGYTPKSKAGAIQGVAVSGNGIRSVKTNRDGVATIRDDHYGVLVLRASPGGFVRSEVVVNVAR